MCKDNLIVLILTLTYPITFLLGMGLEQAIQQKKAVEANVAYYDSKTKYFKFIDVKDK